MKETKATEKQDDPKVILDQARAILEQDEGRRLLMARAMLEETAKKCRELGFELVAQINASGAIAQANITLRKL